MTLALMGSSNGETEPTKATYYSAGRKHQPTLTALERIIPVTPYTSSDKSPGNLVVELVTPKGTNNLTEGTNKNELKVKGMSIPK
jgi:hypothetical protein